MSKFSVQVAVMAALNAHPDLPPFYDRTPAKTALPYGSYGPPVRTRRGVLGKTSQRHSIEINWWDAEKVVNADGSEQVYGNSRVEAYAAIAQELLDGNPLALSDGAMVRLRWLDDTSLPEAENNVRRVRQIYRIDTEEAS